MCFYDLKAIATTSPSRCHLAQFGLSNISKGTGKGKGKGKGMNVRVRVRVKGKKAADNDMPDFHNCPKAITEATFV